MKNFKEWWEHNSLWWNCIATWTSYAVWLCCQLPTGRRFCKTNTMSWNTVYVKFKPICHYLVPSSVCVTTDQFKMVSLHLERSICITTENASGNVWLTICIQKSDLYLGTCIIKRLLQYVKVIIVTNAFLTCWFPPWCLCEAQSAVLKILQPNLIMHYTQLTLFLTHPTCTHATVQTLKVQVQLLMPARGLE